MLVLVGACSGAGDDDDDDDGLPESMSFTVNGGPAVTYGDADLTAAYFPTPENPVPALFTAVKAGSAFSGVGTFLTFSGDAAGSLAIEEGEATFSYTESGTTTYIASEMFATLNSAVGGTYTISEYGAAGEEIGGSFVVTAVVMSNGNPTASTAEITGTFAVERLADGSPL